MDGGGIEFWERSWLFFEMWEAPLKILYVVAVSTPNVWGCEQQE